MTTVGRNVKTTTPRECGDITMATIRGNSSMFWPQVPTLDEEHSVCWEGCSR